jgi:hypothetical protein
MATTVIVSGIGWHEVAQAEQGTANVVHFYTGDTAVD